MQAENLAIDAGLEIERIDEFRKDAFVAVALRGQLRAQVARRHRIDRRDDADKGAAAVQRFAMRRGGFRQSLPRVCNAGDGVAHGIGHHCDRRAMHGDEQRILGLEMIVDRTGEHACVGADVAHVRRVKSAGTELAGGGFQNLLPLVSGGAIVLRLNGLKSGHVAPGTPRKTALLRRLFRMYKTCQTFVQQVGGDPYGRDAIS